MSSQKSSQAYLKKNLRNTINVSNSLNPGQAQHFVVPDLNPNSLQVLSAGDKNLH